MQLKLFWEGKGSGGLPPRAMTSSHKWNAVPAWALHRDMTEPDERSSSPAFCFQNWTDPLGSSQAEHGGDDDSLPLFLPSNYCSDLCTRRFHLAIMPSSCWPILHESLSFFLKGCFVAVKKAKWHIGWLLALPLCEFIAQLTLLQILALWERDWTLFTHLYIL